MDQKRFISFFDNHKIPLAQMNIKCYSKTKLDVSISSKGIRHFLLQKILEIFNA